MNSAGSEVIRVVKSIAMSELGRACKVYTDEIWNIVCIGNVAIINNAKYRKTYKLQNYSTICEVILNTYMNDVLLSVSH